MEPAKVKINGVWLDTDLYGMVKAEGIFVPFGPETDPGTPTLESFVWPNEPTQTDLTDGPDAHYNMGIRFHLLQDSVCYGVRWRVPDSVVAPPGGHMVSLWNRTTELKVASKVFTPTPGGYQNVLFDEPIDLVSAPQEYVAAVYTNHYVYSAPTPNVDWLVESPSLNLRGDLGKLAVGEIYPASDFQAWYYVSPLIEA